MNELHRVLKHGGIAKIEVPSASHGAGFAQDPTHVSQWCMNSFQYYERLEHKDEFARQRLGRLYGITARFKVRALHETEYMDKYEPVFKVHATLEAVK